MIKTSLEINGLNSLIDDFNLLSRIEQKKVAQKAVRAGAIVFRDVIRQNAPVRSGRLRKSISVDTARNADAVTAGVTFKKVRGFYPFYWWILERGSSKLAPNPFVRQAFDANVEAAEKAAASAYIIAIDEILQK